MDAAGHVVVVAARSTVKKPEQVTPADVLALVFGEYRMRATEVEAAECLAAALVERGYRADHLAAGGARYEVGPAEPTVAQTIVALRAQSGGAR